MRHPPVAGHTFRPGSVWFGAPDCVFMWALFTQRIDSIPSSLKRLAELSLTLKQPFNFSITH
jgi:hypothetical protein